MRQSILTVTPIENESRLDAPKGAEAFALLLAWRKALTGQAGVT